jgi:hypothetical protein
MICQFKDHNLYQFPKVPKTLEDILKMKEFKDSNVLIMDTPISISNSEVREQGAAGYAWTSDVNLHNSRIGQRRVIHVSSLGPSTHKETERCMISMQERVMRPWTRQDFINALQDPDLKRKVCKTLDIPADEASNQTAEDLVDRKFYYSGTNARWFFNFTIIEIQEICEDIIKRISPNSLGTGDKHREAVNSAFQTYWDKGRSTVLCTSAFMAQCLGRNKDARTIFMQTA